MLNSSFNLTEQIEFHVSVLIEATLFRDNSKYETFYLKLGSMLKKTHEAGLDSAALYLAIADFTLEEPLKLSYLQRALKLSHKEKEIKDQIHFSMGLTHFQMGQKSLAKFHMERSVRLAKCSGHNEFATRVNESMNVLNLL